MRSFQRPALSTLLALSAGTLAALVIWHGGSASPHAKADSTTVPITINAPTGDVFTPAPPGSSAPLTEQQAMAAFMAVDPQFNPPGTVSYQLGTLDPGPGQNEGPAGEQVWAFSWHECPESHDMYHFQNSSNDVCTEWMFLHADTGKMIIIESQE